MSLNFDIALQAVQAAVREINLSLPDDKQLSDDPDATLFGEGSDLDSMGLDSGLIVKMEAVWNVVQRFAGIAPSVWGWLYPPRRSFAHEGGRKAHLPSRHEGNDGSISK